MALPKRPSDGEAGDFKSINATGTTRDPTQRQPKRPDSVILVPRGSGTSDRWGQWNPGRRDDQGVDHDW